MDDQKALSAASKSLRYPFVAQIQIVTVTYNEDFAFITQCWWPLLSMVVLNIWIHHLEAVGHGQIYVYVAASGSFHSHAQTSADFCF